MCVDDHLFNLLDWRAEWCHPAECKHLSVQDEAKQSPALPAGHWAQGPPLRSFLLLSPAQQARCLPLCGAQDPHCVWLPFLCLSQWNPGTWILSLWGRNLEVAQSKLLSVFRQVCFR